MDAVKTFGYHCQDYDLRTPSFCRGDFIDTPKKNELNEHIREKLERRWVLLQFKKDLFAVNKPINSPIHFEVEERTCDAFPEKYHKTL